MLRVDMALLAPVFWAELAKCNQHAIEPRRALQDDLGMALQTTSLRWLCQWPSCLECTACTQMCRALPEQDAPAQVFDRAPMDALGAGMESSYTWLYLETGQASDSSSAPPTSSNEPQTTTRVRSEPPASDHFASQAVAVNRCTVS